ncbi:hypothetical protein [Aurantiacibacter suaedae]|uniref:hypothetical protein n=1 Tax=Aurantiacibacter suaedae TaxID=2545755 RepID=UPI0010F43838|nr:hypothetical protein [Aurantiacibacter suaedae]
MEGLEPLLPEIWIRRVEMLAASLEDDELDKDALARFLRLTYHLCLLAPEAIRIKALDRDNEACLEALLDASQLDCAATLLLGASPELEIHRGRKGAKVSVRLFSGGAIGKAVATTAAQALLAAIMECLLIEHELNQAIQTYPLTGGSPHRSQSGSRR